MDFFRYVKEEVERRDPLSLKELTKEAININNVYLVLVDILSGFCEEGALASERIKEVVSPITKLVEGLRSEGLPLRNLIFLNDAHKSNAVEFNVFPPHCVKGSPEAEVVQELRDLQGYKEVNTFYKNATNALFGKNDEGFYFFRFLDQLLLRECPYFIVVGDCTDLCVYQNAVGIQLFANERNVHVHVVVSKAHTRTYHLSVEDAKDFGVLAHDADVMETMFLYHMMLNGIKIVSDIQVGFETKK